MDHKTQQEYLTIKRKYEDELLKLDDVHAVSIGYKIIDGKQSDELAIVIHTVHKKEEWEIPAGQKIPEMIEGIPTDVVELPPFKPLPINTGDTQVAASGEDNAKYRPVPGGVEIYSPTGPDVGGICTLGMYAKSTRSEDASNDIYLLTNAHCLTQQDQQVRQPKSNNPSDAIAYASRVVRSDRIDGGIAQMIRPDIAEPLEILDIGSPRGAYDVTANNLGEGVIKRGRTTGTTEGNIAYVDVTLIDIRNQIIVGSDIPFAAPGDSGSAVLMLAGEHEHDVIGLLWGGVLNYAILSPIQAVIEELEIDLITTDDEA